MDEELKTRLTNIERQLGDLTLRQALHSHTGYDGSSLISINGVGVVAGNLYLQKVSQTAVTTGFVLRPTSSYQILTASLPVTSSPTTSIDDGSIPGQMLVVQGTSDTNTITMRDNVNTKMAGDVTLGANDSIIYIWDGVDWTEIARSNN